MENIFEQATLTGLTSRINNLQPNTQRQWGKMDVTQMMAHCRHTLEVAVGERQLKSSLMMKVMGGFIKKIMVSEKPFKQGLPTAPEYLITDPRDFEKEKQQLVSVLTRFSNEGPASAESRKHPIFGKFTAGEWSTSNYKHLDHHLRQFGV